ncbi:uncharacterized protein LOC131233948 [Magnolia sinica]|uniref:uncharacterized protein LOC131233948 n=1 Tax=Magnolia sinica TaxID=86752 RepID=UPI00265A17CD|nr:uncharacterized protein LOC131233948 [Magnolia sinica]
MDYAASLTEAQQQLLAQYQQHLQQQQQQQQQQPQQQQQQATQAYDPSQVQAYDPTSQAYYPYPQQYQNSTAHHQHQQPYPYYPDYGNSAATAAAAASNAYQQTDSSSQPQDLSAAGAQQYYPQDQQGSYSASSGLNPAAAAAVAALSQLTQFAGTMDAAERAVAEQQWNNGGAGQVAPQQNPPQHGGAPVHPPAGPGPYRGGGRRGGGPFRGGKGNFGHRHPRHDGGAPPFRGRGRGRGGGRRFPQSAHEVPPPYPGHAQEVLSPYPEHAPVYEPAPATVPVPTPAPAQAQAPPRRPPPTVIFCELCRVDCNSMEIFEKHKVGKRHKKNMQKLEELENQKKLAIEAESQPKTVVQPENIQQVAEENKVPAPGNVTVADTVDENKAEGEQQIQTAEQSEAPKAESTEASAKKRKRDNSKKKTPIKRKTKFVQDGRRMRPEVVRPEAPRELPVHCALCNVTCDTMAVFQCHLAGKKHASRIKRSQVQPVAYVPPTGVALYIPHGSAPVLRGPPPVASEPAGQLAVMTTTEGHQAATAECGGQDAVMVEAGGQKNAVSGSEAINPNASSSVPAAEYGVSSTEHSVLPGLDIELREPDLKSEQVDGPSMELQ